MSDYDYNYDSDDALDDEGEFFGFSMATKKKDLLRRVNAIDKDREALRARIAVINEELAKAKKAAREADGKRATAEMTLRSIKAAVQVVLNFASDEPPAPGKFYIDPEHGAVTRIPATSPRKA